MWEKKEDPLWKNYEISVWISTIITVLFFWVWWFVNQGFDWEGVGMLSIVSLIFGPFFFKIYIFLFGVFTLLIEWFKKNHT